MKRQRIVRRAAALLLCASAAALPQFPVGAADRDLKGMVEARQRFFGKKNVDPRTGAVRKDRVIMSWFSVASYAASFNGHVVLIDAWVARGSHSGYVPTDPKEVASLDPEYIFVGHGDFDHIADAAEIVDISGAKVVGTQAHCDSISEQLGKEIGCVAVFPGDPPAGLAKDLSDLIPGVGITAISHIHSAFEGPEQDDGGRLPCPPIWNPGDTVEHPPTPEDFQHLVQHLPDPRGGNILYQFRIRDLAIAWHDTTGKLKEDAPEVIERLEALPPTDIHFGAILAFGQVTNCLRDLGMYIEALRPDLFTPSHHDNFTWFIGANAEDLEPYVREEIERIPEKTRPELFYTYDPDAYIKPNLFTFNPRDRRWRD
ncbi:MAG: MBL fold metallo-hydrolase [Actinomycetota bacterium]